MTDSLPHAAPGHDAAERADEEPPARVIEGDCRAALGRIADDSVQMVLTDPPYFLDGLDGGWRKGGDDTPKATGSVGGLPVGMKFDPRQGRQLQAFIEEVAGQWLRVLAPGGFALCFSQPRLAHRVAVGMEDAGFEIRDMIVWNFTRQAQFKAFSQDHFVRRMKLPADEKDRLIRSMAGRKTPQLRPQHESIILAQKPRRGTFVENWQRYGTGLIDSTKALHDRTPANVMSCEKPALGEREAAGGHLTPKPVELLGHLIELFTTPGQIVLDSFLGSGSTAVAALATGRRCIGIEVNPDYAAIARARIAAASPALPSA